MSMRDYVQKTRHLVSCIVTNPIDVASQVHVFIFGMREGLRRYCLTRAEPSTLEAVIALALREDYAVASSYARALTPNARASVPSPWRLMPSKPSRGRSRSARGPRFSNDIRPRDGRHLVCYRWRKSGHRVVVCRATAPVLASAEVVGEAGDTLPQKPVGTSSLHVAGAECPLRSLLDSRATNNFIRDDCLALLPSHVRVRDGPGEIVVKLADGKPHRAPRRAVSLAYAFDGFSANDDFLVIELSYAFDCILGVPWLARYQPEIDWLARSVRRRVGYDVSEVFHSPTHRPVAPRRSRGSDIHDTTPTTRERWPSLCGVRGLRHWSSQQPALASARGHEEEHGRAVVPVRDECGRASAPRLPLENAKVEQRLPFADDSVAQQDLRDTGMVETESPCLEEGEVSSSTSSSSETSASSSGSRRLTKSKCNRSGRHLRRRSTAGNQASSSEILNVVEYSEGSPNQVRANEVENPSSDAVTITGLPGLSWKHFLRDLKAGEIEQVCLLTGSDEPTVLANAVSDDASSSRPKAAEPKYVREARFAAQSWQAFQYSNNPVYSLAREFEDIFPKKISAELPAERGVRHEIDLVPGSKYCVTRQ
ncbi:hypothetical protein PF005_g15423 [Phytophthora fragariae]|uniref:Polyprotein n=1 Tax=Phytophthora fragariae TaxID=53985 RepID=A0A6A3XL40_9STRA|nr:hypothetical protein PF005_g15423 [Phytophthora fragariae]KAE9222000.1 hypothetical protein PF002_g15406 [Phytophthora fragariae]